MKEALVLAVDIGGTYTKLGLVNKEGKTSKTQVLNTRAGDPFPDYTKRIKEEIEKLIAACPGDFEIVALGIGAPNANVRSGCMENPPNFSWGKSIPLKKAFEELSGLPVFIANDANAAALGELRFGLGKGLRNFVVLTLGTGLGSGIISEGRLLVGGHGMAGELGHVNIDPEGRQCNCGLRGCLENYASVTGIRRTVFELIAERTDDSSLRSVPFDELNGEQISEAAMGGDPIALEAFERTAEVLGSKMADTAAHLDPQAFILSGGLSKAGDILLKPLRAAMERNLFVAYRDKIQVIISKAARDQAVLGPAALAWLHLEEGEGQGNDPLP